MATGRFMLPHARLPDDPPLLVRIEAAAARLVGPLGDLDEQALPISDYQRRYLRDALTANPRRTWQKYGYLLAWAAGAGRTSLDQAVLVDYGGGSGLLAVLAKALGIGTVLYVDSFAASCTDARTIGTALGFPADGYVHGELDETIAFLGQQERPCDMLVANNVIEHVYDVEAFLTRLADLSAGALTAVLATAATPYNPWVRRRFMREQRRDELVDRPPAWGDKASDGQRAYRTVRAEVIARHAPDLRPDDVARLAEATRGRREGDIRTAVDDFRRTGRWPRPPAHPTNTCDPLAGNWTEHLMDFDRLADVLRQAGFDVELLAGYYATPRSRPRALLGEVLNLAIRYGGRGGLALAPYVTLMARRAGP